jgi:hypothetical protein
MKRLILTLVGLALVVSAPASSAATPQATIRAQRATIAKLKAQLTKVRRDDGATISGLRKQLETSSTDLATRTSERDTANASLATTTASLAAQTTLTSQAAAGAIAGFSADQLWSLLGSVYTLMPNSSLCGYGRSFYSSGNYTSYDFTRFLC